MLVIYWIQRKHFGYNQCIFGIEPSFEKVYVYAHMKNDQDTRVAKYQEYQSKGCLFIACWETFAFYEPEFMAITDEQYKAFVSEVPALEQYGHYFDRLLEKKNMSCLKKKRNYLQELVRSLRLVGKPFEILDNADIVFPTVHDDKGEEVQLTHGNYIFFGRIKDRAVRKEAYEGLLQGL